jgi:hypothetical protein
MLTLALSVLSTCLERIAGAAAESTDCDSVFGPILLVSPPSEPHFDNRPYIVFHFQCCNFRPLSRIKDFRLRRPNPLSNLWFANPCPQATQPEAAHAMIAHGHRTGLPCAKSGRAGTCESKIRLNPPRSVCNLRRTGLEQGMSFDPPELHLQLRRPMAKKA